MNIPDLDNIILDYAQYPIADVLVSTLPVYLKGEEMYRIFAFYREDASPDRIHEFKQLFRHRHVIREWEMGSGLGPPNTLKADICLNYSLRRVRHYEDVYELLLLVTPEHIFTFIDGTMRHIQL